MIGKALSVSEIATTGQIITVECHITNGLPSVIIVGFASKAVDEAKERLRAAFQASHINFPKKRITLNLAPADVQKEGAGYDLAMAAAVLVSSGLTPPSQTDTIFLGELGLDGSVRAIRGIIGKLLVAKAKGSNRFIIPRDNLEQAKLVPGISLMPVSSLTELYNHLTSTSIIRPVSTNTGVAPLPKTPLTDFIDFIDISGQDRAKRVLEIAAAGRHNLLFNGPPGTGKSMLAKALLGILPPLEMNEILETTHLHSLSTNDYDKIVTERPFRSPHHSASEVAITGGGSSVRPGEISLAHRGVLFLDELPEYNRSTIESLRQPLEDKVITVARAKQNATFPADFMLVATSNPCPCGYYGTMRPCTCPPHLLLAYQRKLSGPILDRIDLYTEVDGVDHKELLKTRSGKEATADVQKRVTGARQLQQKRYDSATKTNSNLNNKELKRYASLSAEAEALLNRAAEQLGISARSYMRLVKVARTIADLEQSEQVELPHISEAIQYRKQTVTA